MKGNALLTALSKDESGAYSECEDAADVAAVLGRYGNDSDEAAAFAELCYSCRSTEGIALTSENSEDLDPGYYLLANETGSLSLLPVYGSKTLAINSKTDQSTVEIKVRDVNDSTGDISEWQDSADYDIGDAVPFLLRATLTERYAQYEDFIYSLTFTVQESEGLTLDPDSVSVSVDGENCTGFYVIVSDTAVSISIDLSKVSVSGSSVVAVEYSSTLNENASCGAPGNTSTVYLTYSSTPADSSQTTVTPMDTVSVFTYQAVIQKLDGADSTPLAGADFTLTKTLPDGSTAAYTAVQSEDGTTFTFSGLDDGLYLLSENRAPDGYNAIEPVEFEISAEHSGSADAPKLTDLSGTVEGGALSFTADESTGTLSADALNYRGIVLPETGRLGDAGFYLAGGLIAVAASVLLFRRRRARRG